MIPLFKCGFSYGQRYASKPILIDELLRRFPEDAVILDPFLKIACLAKDLFRGRIAFGGKISRIKNNKMNPAYPVLYL